MRRPLPKIASIRDFYAFEQHVATCRRQRGLGMVPEWYRVPVFYFSNPAGVVAHEADVPVPHGCQELDYELELACVIGEPARDLPADDRALECVTGFTIMNDWSAATFSASRWPWVWARAREKTLPRHLVPNLCRSMS